MTRIAICGIRGRMGQALLRLAPEHGDVRVVGGIGSTRTELSGVPVCTIDDAAELMRRSDVVIDFSTPSATAELIDRAGTLLAGRALVIGTTGLSEAARQRLDELTAEVAVLSAANFSVGVNLLLGLVERAAAALDPDVFDIEIIEAHHRRKADAPSGTAIALGEAAARGRGSPLAPLRRDGRSGTIGARTPGEI
ncbi:MAG TPA: 4-hydroxy-tetrahydrodipicolinate reductase, partial [Longimicrobiales bacterium]